MSLIPGVIASGISGHLQNSNYYSIATQTITTTGVTSVTFSSIPQTYTHLQVRMITSLSGSSGVDNLRIDWNGVTSAVYSNKVLYGTGSSVGSSGAGGYGDMLVAYTPTQGSTTIFGATILDVLDYTNTNKYKTIRALTGVDFNGSGQVALQSGSYQQYTAISSIVFNYNNSNTYQVGTQFALYGIK